MRLVTFTSALAAGIALSAGAFAQSPGCPPKAHQTQGIPQGVYESSRPHPKFTAGEQTAAGNTAHNTAGGGGMPSEIQSSDQPHPRFTAGGGGGIPGAVESSSQPRPRFTAGEQTAAGNQPHNTAGGGGGIPGGVYDSSQPHPRFTAGQQVAQAGDPCK